jgi:hypothetical protein
VVARVHCLARASPRLAAGPPCRPAVAVMQEHGASTPGLLPACRYRLHPSICIKKPVAGAAAEELAAACPEVFSVAGDRAVAKPARGNELYLEKVASLLQCWAHCAKCPATLLLPVPELPTRLLKQHCQTADGGAQVRRLAADPRWAGCLELRKRKDHFIFTVESTGALPPHTLFLRAVDVLAAKAGRLLQRL